MPNYQNSGPLINGVNNYSVVVTDTACSSNPLVIPVSMDTPLIATALLRDTSIFENNNNSFALGGTLTGPNNGKFQVRYFSDINNGSKNPAMLNVYDERGVRVFSKYYGISSGYQQMDVDLGAHSSGIYRVDLLDLNGDRIKTGSVIVL